MLYLLGFILYFYVDYHILKTWLPKKKVKFQNQFRFWYAVGYMVVAFIAALVLTVFGHHGLAILFCILSLLYWASANFYKKTLKVISSNDV